MKKYLLSHLPLIIIFTAWAVFSAPYFLQGKVPFPSTYQVNNFAPWSAQEKFWGPVKNGAMPDVITQIYPWKHFTIQSYKSGSIPFWNPNNFSGNPHAANFQTAVFSPFNILFFLFPFLDAWSVIVLLQSLIAGVCMYKLLRSFQISKEGCVLGAVSYMFCGFIVVWMAYGTLSMAIAFLPLSLFAIEIGYKKSSFISFLLLVVSLSFSLFSGHFQTSIYLVLFSFAFFLFKCITCRKKKEALFLLVAFCTGIAITLPQLFLSMQLYLNSVRSAAFIKDGGVPIHYLVTLFSPDFFGNPVTRNDWFGYYAEWSSFVGIIPIIFALITFFKFRNRTIFFFIASSLIIAFLVIDSFVQKLIGYTHLPVLSTSNPSRMIALLSFSLCVLGGFGMDVVKGTFENKNIKLKFPIILVSMLFLSIWISLLLFDPLPMDKTAIAKRNLFLPSALFVISVVLLFVGNFYKNKKVSLVVSSIFILLVVFDSLRFAQKWMPFESRHLVFPSVSVLEGIKKNIGFGRIYGNLGTEVNSYYGFPSIEGYDPLYIGRYGEFVRSADRGIFQEGERSVVKLDRRGKYTERVLDLLGVNLIFHPSADTNQGWAYPVWSNPNKYSVVYQDDRFQLFKNNNALDRVHLFYNYRVIKEDKKIIQQFYKEDFKFKDVVILEEDPHLSAVSSHSGNAKISDYAPNNIKINVQTSSPALLFISDNFYPGWRAKVNEEEVKIYRADYSFRAIIVPSGYSRVEFRYFPL